MTGQHEAGAEAPRHAEWRPLRLFATGGAVYGAGAAMADVLSPHATAIDLTADLSGSIIHVLAALAMHVPPAVVVSVLAGLVVAAASGFLRRRGLRRHIAAAAVTTVLAASALLAGAEGALGLRYLWGWMAGLLGFLGVIAAVSGPQGIDWPSAWLPAAIGALAGEFALIVGLRAMTVNALPGAYWSLGPVLLGAVVAGGVAGYAVALVSRAVGRIRSPLARASLTVGAVAVVAVLVVGLVIAKDRQSWPAPRAAGSDRPNIILISVDTLRADVVGYAGGDARTPNIDSLATESFAFMDALANAPWTRPSFASFMTGRHPHEVGVARSFERVGAGTSAIPYAWRADADTVPELVRDAGYATCAVVTNPHITAEANADQGFDLFVHVARPPVPGDLHIAEDLRKLSLLPPQLSRDLNDTERADHVTDVATRLTSKRPVGPFLLWVHYLAPTNRMMPRTLPSNSGSCHRVIRPRPDVPTPRACSATFCGRRTCERSSSSIGGSGN